MTPAVTYVLPIKAHGAPVAELTEYLETISRTCPVLIVDGSDSEWFDANHRAWSPFARHLPPDPDRRCVNGKVHNVLTALDHVSTDAMVIADDDVRYTPDSLTELVHSLRWADVVIPQNHFDPLPWHARWDTARTLLNRCTGGDFPGTLGVRTEALRATNGYDGDVLFENLELIRTVEAAGGSCARRSDLFVVRRPPTAAHFVRQRVRQAYDEFARPARLAVWGAVLPAVVALRRRPMALLAGAVGTMIVAEAGRRSNGGRRHFPATSSLLAPGWVLERAVCIWVCVIVRVRGGVRYSGGRIVRAANSPRMLRQRHGR